MLIRVTIKLELAYSRRVRPLHHVRHVWHRCITRISFHVCGRRLFKECSLSQDIHSKWSVLRAVIPLTSIPISALVEALVTDATVPQSSTLETDLTRLQSLLDDHVPAYVLVRLDDPPSAWLAVHYVPDTANVRDKVLSNESY